MQPDKMTKMTKMARRAMALAAILANMAMRVSAEEIYEAPTERMNPFGKVLDGFVSFSIEFSSFPDYAGNASSPNLFSYNLLKNIANVTGRNPYIRVGGNTQDYALFSSSQQEALIGTVDPESSPDYPTKITIGPAYFESYRTWPGFRYSHGLNLALGGNSTAGRQSLVETVPLVCRALGKDRLYAWEYGNEPDLYAVSARGPVRPPSSWNETEYARQWLDGIAEVRAQVRAHCRDSKAPRYLAPSFSGAWSRLKETLTWEAGLDQGRDVEFFSAHNYIKGARSAGVTLQDTLMNFTVTKAAVDKHIRAYSRVFWTAANDTSPPLVFGEANSLYNQGRPGVSNTFGAALWGINFNMYAASAGVKRIHMHQGTDYRYQAWQPVDTDSTPKGTKPPYYGSMVVAAMVRDSATRPVRISNIPIPDDPYSAAYVAHRTPSTRLARILVLNMHAHNTTVGGAGVEPLPDHRLPPRRSRTYRFRVGSLAEPQVSRGRVARVHRLLANGSDALSGISYDGFSYNWELDEGRPVRLGNVTTGEFLVVPQNDIVDIDLPDSSAAVISFFRLRD